MKIMTQKYRMIVDDPVECERGQMITDDETVIGFIDKADNVTGVCEVILFTPTELLMEDGMESIQPLVPNWEELFKSALSDASPIVQRMWKGADTYDQSELND